MIQARKPASHNNPSRAADANEGRPAPS